MGERPTARDRLPLRAIVAVVVTALVGLHPAQAGASANDRPSAAQRIALNRWTDGDTSSSSTHQRFYRLPALSRGDSLTITATGPGPVFLCLVDSVDDDTWGAQGCNVMNPTVPSLISGTDTYQMRWTLDRAVSRPMLRVGGLWGPGGKFRIRVQLQRVLTLTFTRIPEVSTTGVIAVRSRRADGSGLPDDHRLGLGIEVNGQRYNQTAPVRDGVARFILRLPADAAGNRAKLTAWNHHSTHYASAFTTRWIDIVK